MNFIKNLYRQYARLGLFGGMAAFIVIFLVQMIMTTILTYTGERYYYIGDNGEVIYTSMPPSMVLTYLVSGIILIIAIGLVLLFTFLGKQKPARIAFLIIFFIDLGAMVEFSIMNIITSLNRGFNILNLVISFFFAIYSVFQFVFLIINLRTKKTGNLMELMFLGNIFASVIFIIFGFISGNRMIFNCQHLVWIYNVMASSGYTIHIVSFIFGIILMLVVPSTMYCGYITLVDSESPNVTYSYDNSSSYSDDDF